MQIATSGPGALIGPALVRHAAFVVSLVLVVMLGHGLARLTWQIVGPPPPAAMATAVPGTGDAPDPGTVGPKDHARAISALSLFGEPGSEPQVVTAPEPVQETPLNLRLGGVLYGGGGGIALIAEAGGPESRYRPGDSLPGGARLERVLPRQVILSRSGREETLTLPRDSDTTPGSLPASLPTAAVAPTGVAAGAMPVTVAAGGLAGPLDPSAGGSADALQDLAFASPYVENGRFVGFRLRPGRRRELLGQLGLQSGDILTEVNGVRLENPAQGVAALQGLTGSGQVSVRVVRGGEELAFTFDLDRSAAH